ncbi:PKD domain-containing protein [Streptomyces adustus]|uniref:PKD domain-containing protein n=1 Tax=Streptomyces adustus TaxID=1609272 RepID=UPI0037226B3D
MVISRVRLASGHAFRAPLHLLAKVALLAVAMLLVGTCASPGLAAPAAAPKTSDLGTQVWEPNSWADCLDVSGSGRTYAITYDASRHDYCHSNVPFSEYQFSALDEISCSVSYGYVHQSSPTWTITFASDGMWQIDGAAYDAVHDAWYDDGIGMLTVGDPYGNCNAAPTVSAGPDQTLHGTDTATLQGAVQDDGRPLPAHLTSRWQKAAGPGTVSFKNAASAATTATFSQPGRYTLRLTGSDGAQAGTALVHVTVVEHYRVEVRAWIPQAHVVDPYHPTAVHLLGNTADSWSACGHLSGHLVESSTFRGDNHRLFDDGSGTFRGRVWVEFDWDGTSMTHITTSSPKDAPVSTHRDWVFTKGGKTIRCTTVKTATKTVAATWDAQHRLHLHLNTRNPLVSVFPGLGVAPAIDSDLRLSFSSPTTLVAQAGTDLFPDHGFRVWRDGKVVYTRTTNQAACVNASGLYGATELFKRLLSQTNNVTSTISTHAAAKSLDATCKP